MQIPPRLRSRLETLPFPVRFSDGRIRLSAVRLALLQRVWNHMPVGAPESRQALEAYDGGDVLDIGAVRDLGRHFRSVDVSVIAQPVGDGAEVVASWPAGSQSHPRFAKSSKGHERTTFVDGSSSRRRIWRPCVVVNSMH